MSQFDPAKIEEYQLLLMKDPRSPVFAALAEAYRQMGLLEEALDTCQKGIKHNPEFVSGLVAYGKVLIDLKNYPEALKVLHKAHLLKPENILALRLLGHSQMRLKLYPEALKTFKKLLIHSPHDEAAVQFVKRWEFLEHVNVPLPREAFEWQSLADWVKRLPSVDDAIHLVDSLANSEERASALEVVNAARMTWPQNEALKSRQDLLYTSVGEATARAVEPVKTAPFNSREFRKSFYQHLLRRIESRKALDPS